MAIKKNIRPILWVTALCSLVLAYILDVSKFGGWAHIDISMIFFTLGLIFLGGLFLALFMFRKKKYKERILLTTPIAVIFFSFLIFSNIVIYEYGLFDECNYFSAKRDIKHGKIQLITTGLILPEENEKALEAIRNQFGFQTVWTGCSINKGNDRYNAAMEQYLDKINGKNWTIRLQQKLDSVRHIKLLQDTINSHHHN